MPLYAQSDILMCRNPVPEDPSTESRLRVAIHLPHGVCSASNTNALYFQGIATVVVLCSQIPFNSGSFFSNESLPRANMHEVLDPVEPVYTTNGKFINLCGSGKSKSFSLNLSIYQLAIY
jgi:hypothetical protein